MFDAKELQQWAAEQPEVAATFIRRHEELSQLLYSEHISESERMDNLKELGELEKRMDSHRSVLMVVKYIVEEIIYVGRRAST